jgi:hypothetical protein
MGLDAKVTEINTLYQQAPDLAKKGEIVVRADGLTGVRALERKHPGLPPAPGKVERREFEYTRHGTASFTLAPAASAGVINSEVATGRRAYCYGAPDPERS